MDALDVRIFCEMAFGTTSFSAIQDRQVGPSEIGRKVGLDEKTVRVRVKKMENEGFIKYYQVMPNLALFGLGLVGYYRLETLTLQTKYNLLEKTHQVPFLVETIDYLGMNVSTAIAGPTREEIQGAVDRLSTEFELVTRELHQRRSSECTLRLDTLDWQIIKELRYSARRSSIDLSKALGITPRMAQYRIRRLLDSGAMLVKATTDPKKQTGLIFYELELAVDDTNRAHVAAELSSRFGERLWSTLLSKGILLASLFCFSMGEAEDAAISSGKIHGVKSCSMYLLKETIEPRGPNWTDRLIEEKLSSR